MRFGGRFTPGQTPSEGVGKGEAEHALSLAHTFRAASRLRGQEAGEPMQLHPSSWAQSAECWARAFHGAWAGEQVEKRALASDSSRFTLGHSTYQEGGF